jgi:uncharacterized membrane protein YwaF
LATISRAWGLTGGIKGHIIGTVLLTFVLLIICYMIVGAVGGVLAVVSHIPFAAPLIQVIGQIAFYPLLPIVFTLLYYDARIRKEGFDIQLMAQQVAGGATPQPAV